MTKPQRLQKRLHLASESRISQFGQLDHSSSTFEAELIPGPRVDESGASGARGKPAAGFLEEISGRAGEDPETVGVPVIGGEDELPEPVFDAIGPLTPEQGLGNELQDSKEVAPRIHRLLDDFFRPGGNTLECSACFFQFSMNARANSLSGGQITRASLFRSSAPSV